MNGRLWIPMIIALVVLSYFSLTYPFFKGLKSAQILQNEVNKCLKYSAPEDLDRCLDIEIEQIKQLQSTAAVAGKQIHTRNILGFLLR